MNKDVYKSIGWGYNVIFSFALIIFWSMVLAIPIQLSKKEYLDTYIVVISLLSLILNNLMKCNEKLENWLIDAILKHLFFLKTGAGSIAIAFFFGLLTGDTKPLRINETISIICIFIILYGLLCFLTKFFEEHKSRINLIFVLWWTYILIIYIFKIFQVV